MHKINDGFNDDVKHIMKSAEEMAQQVYLYFTTILNALYPLHDAGHVQEDQGSVTHVQAPR